MAFQVSPGINVSEIDLTAGIQQVSVSDGACAGPFQWGPVLDVQSIASEDDLVKVFGKPDSTIYAYWYTAQSFLAYANRLRVVRAVAAGALNATTGKKTLTGTISGANGTQVFTSNGTAFATTQLVRGQTIVVNGTTYAVNVITNTTSFTVNSVITPVQTAVAITAYGVLVKNQGEYYESFGSGTTGYGAWIAKWAGELGNSIKVSVCPSANAFSNANLTGSIATTSGSTTVTGTTTAFTSELLAGDTLTLNGHSYAISSITNAISLEISSGALASDSAAAGLWTREWQYADLFDRAPGTSAYVSDRAGAGDELHVVMVDEDGLFTGIPGTVLERYSFLSKASDAKNANGENNYYVDVINRKSLYAWWFIAPGSAPTNYGTAAAGVTFGTEVLPSDDNLIGGQTDNTHLTDGNIETAYDLFKNADTVDISLVMTGPASAAVASYIIQNICEYRGDCVAFCSPLKADVVNNADGEVAAIVTTRNSYPSSSYAFLDSGWKYQYDKYNDTYRWVPLNGDTAGISAKTDTTNDPWFSPAGFSRGQVKNVVKLAWNPKQIDRDDLYKIGVNPIVQFPGQGTLLYGDKTLLSRPSAFDRINVRRLFIVLEKTISRLARTQLFEFNDEFTRSQFRNIVEPFLRDVKARRGVTDYRVICDESNNTQTVIDSNSFVGDIYVKPSRSINFIQLNFVAVRSGVSFQEVTGAVQ